MPFEWQPELDALDEVPEKYRPLYAQAAPVEGQPAKFSLDADVAKRMDTSTLTTTLKKERDGAKTLKAQMAAWMKLAATPEEGETLVGDLRTQLEAALKSKDSAGAAAWEKQRTELEGTHSKVLTAKENELTGMRESLHTYMAKAELTAELSAKGAAVDMLLGVALPCVKVIEEGGKFSVRVVDAQGEPRENKSGSPLTVREYVAELEKDSRFARGFPSSGSSGSAMRPEGTTGVMPSSGKPSALGRISRGLKQQ